MSYQPLKGQKALVTGASSGIGLGVTRALEPRIQQLHDDLAHPGLHPFHVPLGVMLDEQNPQTSRCTRGETCDGHPCLVGASPTLRSRAWTPRSGVRTSPCSPTLSSPGSRPGRRDAR